MLNSRICPAPHDSRPTAIVFDDDIETAKSAKARLQQEGYEVDIAQDEHTFTAALASRPSLVLLDLSLDGMDGIQAFSLILAHYPAADVLLFSGHSEQVIRHARRIGEQMGIRIIGHLKKPFRRQDVREALRLTSPRSNESRPRPRVQLEHGLLETALENDWVEFWYQPKIELSTGTMIGAECLARIRHPKSGTLAPGDFLSDALEQSLIDLSKGAIADITRCSEQIQFNAPHFHYSINISGRTLHRPDVLDDLIRCRGGLKGPAQVLLELTETDFVADAHCIEHFSTRATLHGFGISIDDFGHGYATFDRLRRAPFCELKIDRSVVNGCSRDDSLRTICKASVDLAHGFCAKVVAEGIDNIEDLATIRSLNFDVAQGYLFSPPVPRDQFIRLPERYEIRGTRNLIPNVNLENAS